MSTVPNRWYLPRPFSRQPSLFLTVVISAFVLLICLALVRHGAVAGIGSHSPWLNRFDLFIASNLASLTSRSSKLDWAMFLLAEHNLLKGAPIVFLCWAAFFEKLNLAEAAQERRAKLAAVVSLAIPAVILGRAFAVILPFRERPFRTAGLHFQLPHGMSLGSIYTWSSFPSDHAILFLCLAVGVFFASHRLGVLAIAYVALFIALPRLFLGIHWPTDVLAGSALGLAIAAIATIPAYRDLVWRLGVKAWQTYPGIFAASMFILSYEITDLFDGPIAIAQMVLKHRHH
ncbi:MAG TPA: phosphatase PAP2 family protein [Acidobacteriaceae bacterium]|nr:phosphatase PAP2 family protein [Acidobacteriaceae bacterium]